MPRITKSRDPILASLREANMAALMTCVHVPFDTAAWDAAYERELAAQKAMLAREAMFRPRRVRKAERKATEMRRIVAYVAAQPAGFRNHVPATGVSIANAERAAYYRAELVEWRLFTQHGVGLRKEFVAAHKEAMQWATFHRLVAAECGRRLP